MIRLRYVYNMRLGHSLLNDNCTYIPAGLQQETMSEGSSGAYANALCNVLSCNIVESLNYAMWCT